MSRSRYFILLLSAFISLPAYPVADPVTKPGFIEVIELHDTLQPVRARTFAHEIVSANEDGASAILINLSTPGGMSSSVDTMVAAMRKSRIPIIVWTGLYESRVGGEGLRLVAEADAAYMAKDTYLSPLWADTPRDMKPQQRTAGSNLLLTQLNDANQFHGKSPSRVEDLTSGVHWFSPTEATQAGLVNGVSESVPDLLRQADGQTVVRNGKTSQLSLEGMQLRPIATQGENFLLLSLMNPNLDVLLLTLGLLLIYLEINTPGIVVPGAAGLLLVLLTVFALGSLPVSSLGVGLCILALLLLVLEARLHTRGMLAIAGILALIGGLGTLVVGPVSQLQVSWPTAIGAGIGFGGVTAALMVLGSEAKRAKVKTGAEAMLGWLAVAQTPLAPSGRILVRGELWNARLTSNDTTVAAGERVKVLRADGLTLEVTAVPLTQSS
jgi:membrane-bound serine protease (ClpP class)